MFRISPRQLCTTLWALAAGCASSVEPEPQSATAAQTFIGSLAEGDARVAIVRDAARVRAYVCGAGDTLQTHTRWFNGELGQAQTELDVDGWRLRLFSDAAGLRGELESPDGAIIDWQAAPTPADAAESEVGLYQASTDGCRTGVIVWQAEAGPGCRAQGVYCDALGHRSQVTPLQCAPGEPLRVETERAGERLDFVAERVLSP